MAYGDPYCGNCHTWMVELFTDQWVCDCTVSGQSADTTKDPNCKNRNHAHHDPLSPIVLLSAAEVAAEHGGIDEETKRELDEILKDTNEQVEVARPLSADDFVHRHPGVPHHDHGLTDDDMTDGADQMNDGCLIFGHVWVKHGRVGLTEHGLSGVDWGPPKCLRCGEPAPEEVLGATEDIVAGGGPITKVEKGFVAREGPTDRPGGVFDFDPHPKHACGGCNLRDLTLRDAKEHIRKLLKSVGKSPVTEDINTICLEARRFLRMMDSKIRAMKEED